MSKSVEIEEIIVDILSSESDDPPSEFDFERSFDSFGLDSVSRVRLLVEMERRLGIELSVEDLMDCETPKELADAIAVYKNEA